jgi:hypothetical protein
MVLGEALQRWTACLGMHVTGPCTLAVGDAWLMLGLLCVVIIAACVGWKLNTVLLTWRAMAWAPGLSRRLSKWVKSYDYPYNVTCW